MISNDATDEEIKKQYRQLSILVHPDKCLDSRASDAFHILETAYKTLQDSEKKKFFQRIIREAKERVDLERKKENKLRIKKGQPPLPSDSLDFELKQMIKKVIDEIDERKEHTERIETSHKKREREEEEIRYAQEEYEKHYNKEWESYRDKRVKNWNKFQSKITNGKRKGKYETKPPRYKTEERIENKIDLYRPNTII
jgi:DnaJ family protein C protein 8